MYLRRRARRRRHSARTGRCDRTAVRGSIPGTATSAAAPPAETAAATLSGRRQGGKLVLETAQRSGFCAGLLRCLSHRVIPPPTTSFEAAMSSDPDALRSTMIRVFVRRRWQRWRQRMAGSGWTSVVRGEASGRRGCADSGRSREHDRSAQVDPLRTLRGTASSFGSCP